MTLQNQPKIAFIGDDFTGSIDTMETLHSRGINCVLFLKPPTPNMRSRFSDPDAVGVATSMRSMSPGQIEDLLPRLLKDMSELGADVLHYKVCSTFDSSPMSGSIGKVIDLYKQTFPDASCLVVLGQPNLARYGVFGNLFARLGSNGPIFRIDRHPSMSRHPITPMHEADMLRHISSQTNAPITLLNYVELTDVCRSQGITEAYVRQHSSEVVVIDVANQEGVGQAGQVIRTAAQVGSDPVLVVGASTVAQAVFDQRGPQTPCAKNAPTSLSDTEIDLDTAVNGPLLVISGSCSPVTADQIDAAVEVGFEEFALDPESLLTSSDAALLDTLLERVSECLSEDRSVILHTCHGPDDPRRGSAERLFSGTNDGGLGTHVSAGIAIAKAVQRLVQLLMSQHGLSRLCLTGGDFSSTIVQGLGIDALTLKCPISPGVSLCTAHSDDLEIDQLEIALKGGQMGKRTYFADLQNLRPDIRHPGRGKPVSQLSVQGT